MPLHEPNEFIEWRDQQPVISTYHQTLVRCVLKLNDVSQACVRASNAKWGDNREGQHWQRPRQRHWIHNEGKGKLVSTSTGSPASASAVGISSPVIVQAINSLLRQWPGGRHANTPKEVLFIHELEALLIATPLQVSLNSRIDV